MYKTILGVIGLVAILAFLRFSVFSSNENNVSKNLTKSDSKKRSLKIGYLPVTCHLTCPVTDYTSKTTTSSTIFESKRFSDFPTVVSAIQAKELQASFMVVPLAMKLREDGVPIKICYLGHRDGSEIVVPKNSKAKSLRDLKGSKIGIPSLYSNQHFVLLRLLEKQGMSVNDIEVIPIPPPDMPTSLAAGAIDAFFVGEPFCAKAELENIGRVLYYASEISPNFISCALVVHEDLIKEQPEVVRDLVRGIAESGAWIEGHRAEAAKLAAKYYRQDPKILNYVLTSQPQRVKYTELTPVEEELQQVVDMGRKIGLLKGSLKISDLIDAQFIPKKILFPNITVNN